MGQEASTVPPPLLPPLLTTQLPSSTPQLPYTTDPLPATHLHFPVTTSPFPVRQVEDSGDSEVDQLKDDDPMEVDKPPSVS